MKISDKVRWGVLGTATIAIEKAIPAMQRGRWTRVEAIASRQSSRAEQAAKLLGIPKACGSYDALLQDSDIEAVYIPLPNHLHVPWSVKAAQFGKHVLCEKPIGLGVAETRSLLAVQARTGVRIQEAFMVHSHPQWRAALDLVAADRVGPVRAVMGHFTYHNTDPDNIRNIAEYGGGALLDVGCYLVYAARRIFGSPPRRVFGSGLRDVRLNTDILTSAVLDFGAAQCVFTCSTRAVHSQRLQILGENARMEFEYPFNAPPHAPYRIFVNDGRDPSREGDDAIVIEPCDQYLLQADDFSKAIREGREQTLPLADSLENMAVIEAISRSMASGRWEAPERC